MYINANSAPLYRSDLNFSKISNKNQKNSNYYSAENANVSFERAFSTREQKTSLRALKEAFKLLGIEHFSLTLPSSIIKQLAGKDPRIGTSNSKEAMRFMKDLQALTGIDSIVHMPDGDTGLMCPYSGSVIAMNPRLTDLSRLCDREYGSLLTPDNSALMKLFSQDGRKEENYVDLEHVTKYFKPVLREAHAGFKALASDHPLQIEYGKFLDKMERDYGDELERHAIGNALSEQYGSDYWKDWKGDSAELDKELFGKAEGTTIAKERIAQIHSEHADDMDFFKFCQFIVTKQHFGTKSELEANGMKLIGDCPVGFSSTDFWAHRRAFSESPEASYYIGAPGDGNEIQSWDLPLLKDNCPEADDLVRKKFKIAHERYSGVRMDAAWAQAYPFIYMRDASGEIVRNAKGEVIQPEMGFSDPAKFIKMFVEAGKEVNGSDWKPDLCMFENLGLGDPIWKTGEVLDGIRKKDGIPMPEILPTVFGFTPEDTLPENWVSTVPHDGPPAESFVKNRFKPFYTLGDKWGDWRRTTLNMPDWWKLLFIGPKEGKGAAKVNMFCTDLFHRQTEDAITFNDFKNPTDPHNFAYIMSGTEDYHKQLANNQGFNAHEVLAMALKEKFAQGGSANVQDAINALEEHSTILKDPKVHLQPKKQTKLKLKCVKQDRLS